jgi:hypothetical protein
MRYPECAGVFMAIPNGSARNPWTAKNLKDEGVLSVAPDLLLLVPRHGFAGLCIEMKKPGGKVSESQKAFKRAVERFKYKYVVCYSVDEFKAVTADYLEK